MAEGLPAGTVTIADLYRELVGMRSDVARALTRIEVIDTRNESDDRARADHEARIRALERFRYTLAGACLVGGAAAGFIGDLIGHGVH